MRKRAPGAWILPAMRVLQALRGVRGTWLDPFRHNAERTLARQLLAGYEADLEPVFAHATPAHATHAVELASLPEHIRGYGHVRQAHADQVAPRRAARRADGRGRAAAVGLTRGAGAQRSRGSLVT